MKTQYCNLLWLFCLLTSNYLYGQQVSNIPCSSQNDVCLWYMQPAKEWIEALPIGNGRLGAMVHGGYPNELIQFNEESLWAGCKTEPNAVAGEALHTIQQFLLDGELSKAFALTQQALLGDIHRIRSYQTFGDIFITYDAGNDVPRANILYSNYSRKLDLETGITASTFTHFGVKYTQEVFVSAVDDVIVIRVHSEQAGKLNLKLSLSRERDATINATGNKELTMTGQIVDLPRANASPAGLHMKFATRVTGSNKGGTMAAVNNTLFVKNADEVVFYLTAATDYNFSLLNFDRSIDPVKKCEVILSKIKEKTYEKVKADHIAEHSAIFNRVSFNLFDDAQKHLPTDKRLEAIKKGGEDKSFTTLLFQFGRYLLMSSSRRPGILPANLQGIWNHLFDAPYNSDYHTNCNVQMNYWPAEVTNLSETTLPLSNYINALRVPGRVTARDTYNSTGWTVNHASDVFGHTAITDNVLVGTYPTAASWLVLSQWEHFLFTQDLNFLRTEAYPSMKEAADFLLGFIIRDKNGKWVTAPSNSPENRYRATNNEIHRLTHGPTKDIQLIRELFNACIKAGKLLGEDKKYMAQLQSVINDLPPTIVSKRYGIIQEWIEDYEEVHPGHRHISQLFGLYPGTEITPANKTLFDAAVKTIERRMEYARMGQGGTISMPGWKYGWTINFYARLGDGEAAGQTVAEMQQERITLNLMGDADSNEPRLRNLFQIDGNLTYTSGIAEMLIQSHQENIIALLPAIPKSWDKGEVKGLKARGNITVDMKWENNRLTAVTLVAANDCNVQVKYNDKIQKISLKKGRVFHLKI